MVQCRAVDVDYGDRCRQTHDINSDGHCWYHRDELPRCLSTSRFGDRCRTDHGLDKYGYCRAHFTQCRDAHYCHGYNRFGEPCGRDFDLDEDGYCPAHDDQCRGYLVSDGSKCLKPAKDDYDYCCAAHDPDKEYIAPTQFEKGNTRTRMMDRVLYFAKDRDLYTREWLPQDLSDYEMDHKVGLQSWAFVFTRVQFYDDEEQDMCIDFVRDCVDNEAQNLCMTRQWINALKARAVYLFQDDYLTGHRQRSYGPTFDDYLAERRMMYSDGRVQNLTPDNIYEIKKEMARGIRFGVRELRHEGDTPIFDEIADELEGVHDDFNLVKT